MGKGFGLKKTPGSKMVRPGAQGNEEGKLEKEWFRGMQSSTMNVRGMRKRRMHTVAKGGGKGVFEAQK